MRIPNRGPQFLLRRFIYGSLLVVLICLCGTALIFSGIYLRKEHERSEISLGQLSSFFDFQYRAISEEMWTRSYDGINLRIAEIARQMGRASYRLTLADERGSCVYFSGASGRCEIPAGVADRIAHVQGAPAHPSLRFDRDVGRYIYFAPLYVGANLRGFLYAELTDPYGFFRGNAAQLAFEIFIIPIGCVILLWAAWLLFSQRMILQPYLASLVDLERREALGAMAAQVAHDIRSPLAALRGALGSAFQPGSLSEAQRRLVTAAASRIESIANGLFERHGDKESCQSQVSCLATVVEAIVAEKRVVLGEKSPIQMDVAFPGDAGAFWVPIAGTELSRVMSNLLNNAIEALVGQPDARIKVMAARSQGRVLLSVEDSGSGMAPDVLHRIRTAGGTFGKRGGAGLGLQHAKATVGAVGGSLNIDSEAGRGTTLTLEMPVVPPPRWFAPRIDLSGAKTVVILDDDPSIHLLWQKRLGKESVVHLTDPEQFSAERFSPESTRFIFDHEIHGSPVTGLDLIVTHRLGNRAVLMTSHSGDANIQRMVEEAGALMIPKAAIPGIEVIGWGSQVQEHEGVDLVLIDDDTLIHELWAFEAAQLGLRVRAVSTLGDLELDALDLDLPLYVDKNLGNVSGLDVAELLHRRGFRNISITTGESLDPELVPSFLREIRGKEFPVEACSAV